MSDTTIVLGCGFDIDLGLKFSYKDYINSYHCIGYQNENWSDFENHLRRRIVEWSKNPMDEVAKDINLEWRAFKQNFSFFFSANITDAKKDTLAYQFLTHLSDKSTVYTFNYTNPYEYTDLQEGKDFIYVHGIYYKDPFRHDLMIASQSHEMIVGVDYNNIDKIAYSSEYIKPIIKRLNPAFVDCDIENGLIQSKRIVFYGLSMGLCDQDYFSPLINSLVKGECRCEEIFFVTYNQDSHKKAMQNLIEIGPVNKDIDGYVKITPIYTQNYRPGHFINEINRLFNII